MNQKECVFAVDIGGTFTKYAIINNNGKVIVKNKFPTPQTYDSLLKMIVEAQSELQVNQDLICISSPCNYSKGALRGSSFVEYLVDRDIIGDFKQKYNKHVLIENDGNCAVLCEHWVGNAQNQTNAICLVIGSGIGGGVILDNKLLKGSENLAGDLGYMLLGSEAKTNNVANCLGILGAARYNFEQISKIKEISGLEEVFSIEMTDSRIVDIREKMCRALAIGIINYKYIFDTEQILLGGEISKNELFIKEVRNQIDLALAELSGYKYTPKINSTKFYNDSNLIGAASMFFNKLESI